jgi:anti-anti-sigma regulatory factor
MSDRKTLTIDNAVEFQKTFLDTLKKGATPVVDLSGIESIDLAGIQLLVAYAREALEKKVDIHFIGTIHESVRASLILAGIAEQSCETGDDVEQCIKAVL